MTDPVAIRLGLNVHESKQIRMYASRTQFTTQSITDYGRNENEKFLKSLLHQGWDSDLFNVLLVKIAVLEYWLLNNQNNTELTAMVRMRLQDLTQVFVKLSVELKPFFEKIKSIDIKKEYVDGYKKSKGSLKKTVGIYWFKIFSLSAVIMTIIATILKAIEDNAVPNVLIMAIISMLIAGLGTLSLMYFEYLDKASTAESIGIEAKRVYEASYLLSISLLSTLSPEEVLNHEFQAVFRAKR